MDQARGMGLRQGLAGLTQEENDTTRHQRAVGCDQPFEAEAGKVFHHVIERAVLGVPVVEDLHRIRVREPGRGPDLVLELLELPRVAGSLGPDQLDGTGAFQHPVFREVDFSHPADPDLLAEAVLVQLPRLDRPDAQACSPGGLRTSPAHRRSPSEARSGPIVAARRPGGPGGRPRDAPGTPPPRRRPGRRQSPARTARPHARYSGSASRRRTSG